MNKSELVQRAAKRARERGYCESFAIPLLNDLIKNALVPEGKRTRNRGKKPTYLYDWRCYRRVLQILRFRGLGIVGRDALLLQLFLRGYGIKPAHVRTALAREYRKAFNQLNRQARSGYLDNTKGVPPKHKQSLMASLGEIDPRLQAAGLAPKPDVMIDFLRSAKQKAVAENRPLKMGLVNTALTTCAILPLAQNSFDGFLNTYQENGADNYRCQTVYAIEDIFNHASDEEYLTARTVFWALIREVMHLGADLISPFTNALDKEIAAKAVSASISQQPEWTVSLYAFCIKEIYGNAAASLGSSEKCCNADALSKLGVNVAGTLKDLMF